MDPNLSCPFCCLNGDRVLHSNDVGSVVRDAYPISPGHSLVIPHRHVASFFDLTGPEHAGLFDLLEIAKRALDVAHWPAAYNIGINDGVAAGQTVLHLHIHLIPRYLGDSPDPRGGVRWIMPERAAYWPKE